MSKLICVVIGKWLLNRVNCFKNNMLLFKKVKRLYIIDNVFIFLVDVCYKLEIYKG